MQKKEVDGQENPFMNIYASKFYEVQKYMSLTYHAYTLTNVVMNLKKYQELKPEYQNALIEAMNPTWKDLTADWGKPIETQAPSTRGALRASRRASLAQDDIP
jgi:TRAP-type C4-dicarboxylate transport system substrate-binding protein